MRSGATRDRRLSVLLHADRSSSTLEVSPASAAGNWRLADCRWDIPVGLHNELGRLSVRVFSLFRHGCWDLLHGSNGRMLGVPSENKGLVSGIIIGGFGLGAFIFSYVALAIVNPEGDKPELSVAGGKIFYPDQL